MSFLDAPTPSTVLAGSSCPVRFWGGSGAAAKTFASTTVKAGSLPPGSVARLPMLWQFVTPNNAGRYVQVALGGQTIAQSFPTASLAALGCELYFYIAPDAKSLNWHLAFIGSVSAGSGNTFGTTTGGIQAATVDLTADQTLAINSQPQNGDTAELVGWSLEVVAPRAGTVSYAPSAAVALWGDSLTAGTGATSAAMTNTGTSWAARLLKRARPVYNGGVGGETSGSIKARILADKARRYWRSVFWMGRNNVGSGTMLADVQADIAACVANLAAGVDYLVMPVTPATNEPNGSANKVAIDALNAALSATYGARFVPLTAALCTQGDGTIPAGSMADTVHPNDTGHATVDTTLDTAITGRGGWA